MSDPGDPDAPVTGSVATLRLWAAAEGIVVCRLTTVDDLAAAEEKVLVTSDLRSVKLRINSWLDAAEARLEH